MPSEHIYLDYAATTPLDPRVWSAMLPYFDGTFGNPSSVHRYGQQAEAALESARETVARVLGSTPEEIVFTSGGTESDNLALRGAASAGSAAGRTQILTSHAEHHAVSQTAERLTAGSGSEVIWLPVDRYGTLSAAAVREALSERTALVSVMYANNEIGTINPVTEIAEACRASRVLLHTDAVQAAAYRDVDVEALGVDLMSLGGHKLYGPKGVGALYVRHGTALAPTQTGGAQERGLRAGTQNVPYIVGFAEALRLAAEEREQRTEHVWPLRDRIIGAVLESIPDSQLTGHPEQRMPNHASFVFKDVDGNLLLQMLDAAGFACSSGSACRTGNPEPSEVIGALGLPREWALGSLRVTLGTASTAQQVEAFVRILPGLVERVRKLAKDERG